MCSAFGGLPPTADGECRAGRTPKGALALADATNVVFSLYSFFGYVHNQ